MTLVLQLIMNDGFCFDYSILLNRLFRVLPGFMGKSLVITVKNQQNVTTQLAHVHAQSEFTYDGYLVAAEYH